MGLDRRWTMLGASVVGILLLLQPALAGHGGAPLTYHVTYEVGPVLEDLEVDDPAGVTQDGTVNTGGVRFVPDGSDHYTQLHPDHAVPHGVDAVQASVVDDVWGSGTVAAHISTDVNGDSVFGDEEQGEMSHAFCGQSPVVDIPPAPNWAGLAVGLYLSYLWQVEDCNVAAAPTGATTGGVLNPAGGIFVTFE